MKGKLIVLVVIAALGLSGCGKAVDKLLGNGTGPDSAAQYPWLYPDPPYSAEFCERYPTLEQCGGDQ